MTATPPMLPPQLPPDGAPAKKKGLSTLAIVLIVVGGVVGLFLMIVVGAAAVVVPQMQERQQRLTCQQNLNQLGSLFAMIEMGARKPPAHRSGPALFLGWRKDKDWIQGGKEDVLVCPGDEVVNPLLTDADRRRYDTIDLANPPRDACSYAVRDFGRFPVPKGGDQPEILAACTHHTKGVNVVYVDGQVKFYEWVELGLTGPEDADVGPDAKSPILRQVCRTPGVTEK